MPAAKKKHKSSAKGKGKGRPSAASSSSPWSLRSFVSKCRLPNLSTAVNRSFRRVEKCADWIVGSAGPVFIGICTGLVCMGAVVFFFDFLPHAVPPQSPSFSLSFLAFPSFLSWCMYLIYAIGWSYYQACHTPPGTVGSFAVAASRLAVNEAAKHRATEEETEEDSDEVKLVHQTRLIDRVEGIWATYEIHARQASRWITDDVHAPAIKARIEQIKAERGMTDQDIEEDDIWPRVKMCLKCRPIPLWKALAVLPPELRDVERQNRTKGKGSQVDGAEDAAPSKSGDQDDSAKATPTDSMLSPKALRVLAEEDAALEPLRLSILQWLPASQANTLVPPPKPERSHHCSVCKVCTIKFDHHCPWLNQCVGLHNERYFVLFLFYMVVGMSTVVATGWRRFWVALRVWEQWSHPYLPRFVILLSFLLCLIMSLALLIMLSSHVSMISQSLTSVESSDASYYKHLARQRKRQWGNVFHLGSRRRNLQVFANVGPVAGWSSLSTSSPATSPSPSTSTSSANSVEEHQRHRRRSTLSFFLPTAYPPYSDGWHWAKRYGTGGKNLGVEDGEVEIDFSDQEDSGTDDDEGEGGEEEEDDADKKAEREVLAGRTLEGVHPTTD